MKIISHLKKFMISFLKKKNNTVIIEIKEENRKNCNFKL